MFRGVGFVRAIGAELPLRDSAVDLAQEIVDLPLVTVLVGHLAAMPARAPKKTTARPMGSAYSARTEIS